jgi:hypothetical protein
MSAELPALLAAAERVARFMETLDEAHLRDAFAEEVFLVENFPPHVFTGPEAVRRWADGFRTHVRGTTGLRHAFGTPLDARVGGDRAYLSIPTTWTFEAGGDRFTETGGWAFVMVRRAGTWRVGAYGWAPTSLRAG